MDWEMNMKHTLLIALLMAACAAEAGPSDGQGAAGSVGVSVQALSITKSFINSDNGAAIYPADKDPLNALRCWVMAKCTGGGLCRNDNYDCYFVPPNSGGIKTRCQNTLSSVPSDSWITTSCTSTGCTVQNGNGLNSGSFRYGSDAHKVFNAGSMTNYGFAECAYSNLTNEQQGKPFVHFWQ
jgi:hypothetical protein